MKLLVNRKWCVTDLVIAPETGRLSESRLWAFVGKALCAWLIVKHADDLLIGSWEVLFILVAFLVMPELLKKYLATRATAGERSDDRDSSDAGRRHRDRGGD